MLLIYVVLCTVFYVSMSNITVEVLNTILDEKLAPLAERINEINHSIAFINHQYEEILKKLSIHDEERKELINENKSLRSELLAATKKLNDMAGVLDNLEQYSRRECVEIRGIPLPANESVKEDTDNIAKQVANLIGVKIESDDISISHRLKTSKSYKGRDKEAPPIIVKFVRRKSKESVYKARRKLNSFTTKDLGYITEQNIFITESLTQKNKDLFKEAYKVKKLKNFKFIWTSSGKIFLRRDETSSILPVTSSSDLQKIK